MKTKKYLIFLLFLSVMVACEDTNVSQQDSQVDETTGADQQTTANTTGPQLPKVFYSVTNDFQEYNGQEMTSATLLLKSLHTGENYIVPPTQYESVALTSFIIDLKVKGKCIEVPASAFPVLVGVCQTEQCEYARPLNTVLQQPAHYNLNGLGGWLTPAVSPVSPCSEESFQLVEAIQPYQQIN